MSYRRKAARSAGDVLGLESQQGGGLPAELAEGRGTGRLVGGKGKILEIEAGPDGASGEGVSARRSSRLPPARGNHENRLLGCFGGPEPVVLHPADLGRRQPQVQRGPLVEVPDFVRLHPVPSAELALGEQEVDGCQGGAAAPAGPTA